MQTRSSVSQLLLLTCCLLVVDAGLVAAQQAQTSGSVEAQGPPFEEWVEFREQLSKDPNEALRQLQAFRDDHGVAVEFWVEEGVSDEQLEALGWYPWDGPCGPTVIAFVQRMPMEHPLIAGDTVLELSAEGHVLQGWTVPANQVHIGLDGDRVLVPIYGGHFNWGVAPHLSIAPDGRFELVLADSGLEGSPYQCPALTAFAGSVYVGCWIVKDRSSGEERFVAYNGPCT